MLMPDSLVHLVVGDVVQHLCLIAIVHNDDIVVRTAAIRVSVHILNSMRYIHYTAHIDVYTCTCMFIPVMMSGLI